MTDAVVVGAGPNGLAAAIDLARAGWSVTVLEAADTIGGGCRSAELFETGVVHDLCSAVHPFGAASPWFGSADLAAHGLMWRHGEVELAHPLDDGTAGVLHRSLDATVAAMGVDGQAWRSAFGRITTDYDHLVGDTLGPLLRLPSHPVSMARFGSRGLPSAQRFARRWHSASVRGLYAGVAAHGFQPLTRPTTAAVGAMFIGAAHTSGWPVAEGGSGRIVEAMASLLGSLGGRIETGVRVGSLRDVPPHRAAVLDVTPQAAVSIAGDRIPPRVRRALGRWRYGPGSFKVDLLVDGPIPWRNDECRRAVTVHCGGTFEEVASAEADVHRGRMPDRPFVLVGQQFLADPTRSSGTRHPVWAYAHVPARFDGDATDAVVAQIERFAPGFRDQIVATAVRSPGDLEAYDANYVGGDIASGANTPWQIVARPRLARDPYRIGDGVYLCSAATPPGAGVHGLCGAHAAASVLRNDG